MEDKVLAKDTVGYAVIAFICTVWISIEPSTANNQLMREVEWSRIIATELDGKTEVRTPDGSRVDVLTKRYAYEVEWVEKWKEAPAQAVFYGLTMNKEPAVILLLRGKSSDRRYYLRCLAVCTKIGIRLETRKTN
jgi:hypothetical protein